MPEARQGYKRETQEVGSTIRTPEILIGKEYAKRVTQLIQEAKSEVLVSVFLWNYYYQDPACEVSQFNIALIHAVQRGVKVKGLVASTAKLKKMIEAGCKIKESCFAHKLHNKIVIIDYKYVILGSHNITKNALGRNYEVSNLFEIEGIENRLYKFVSTMVNHNG